MLNGNKFIFFIIANEIIKFINIIILIIKNNINLVKLYFYFNNYIKN